jgi:hypothetical protein
MNAPSSAGAADHKANTTYTDWPLWRCRFRPILAVARYEFRHWGRHTCPKADSTAAAHVLRVAACHTRLGLSHARLACRELGDTSGGQVGHPGNLGHL